MQCQKERDEEHYSEELMGVIHKVCLDSDQILNVEVLLHLLTGIKIFTKID